MEEEQTKPPIAKTVCGGILRNPENYPSAVYHGRRVYFCTRGCLRAFETDPERFMDGGIPHPIGSDIAAL